MKWPDCVLFPPFTPGSFRVHVAVISLIYTDWGLAGRGDDMRYQAKVDIASEEEGYPQQQRGIERR